MVFLVVSQPLDTQPRFFIYILMVYGDPVLQVLYFLNHKCDMRYPPETFTRLATFDLKYYFVKYKFHEEMKIRS